MKNNLRRVLLSDICEFKTGKLNSNAAEPYGQYPFFTCAPEIYYINNYAFDCEAILLAGNNANGIFNIKNIPVNLMHIRELMLLQKKIVI